MDIDLVLQKLIDKYHMDVLGAPVYVEQLVEKIVLKYAGAKKIALRGAGEHTLDFLKFFEGKIKISAIFDRNVENVNPEILKFNIPVLPLTKMKKEDFDLVIISTNIYRKEMREELVQVQINYLDIYEQLEEQYGIYYDSNFTHSYYNPYLYIIGCCSKYRQAQSFIEKDELLQKIISSFLHNRDIYSTIVCLEEYIKCDYSKKETYQQFLEELSMFLIQIKAKLKSRQHKDIIVLWQDCLQYKRVEKMPFEKSCREKGLYFKNAHTVTPWTMATLKAVLDKRLDIDDYEKKGTNYQLTKFLIENGYDCRYARNERICDLNTWDPESRDRKNEYYAICKTYWTMLKEILLIDNPTMVIAHSLLETHWPNCAPNLIRYSQRDAGLRIIDKEVNLRYEKNLNDILKYVDKETEFFMNLFDNNSVKIIMSDHGVRENPDSRKWDYDAAHVNLLVLGKSIKPRVCDGMFSLINFIELIKYVLEPTNENFENMFTEEVVYQGCDMYNKRFIDELIATDCEEWGIAYRGVESKKDRYVIMGNGIEIYNRLPDEKTNYINHPEFMPRIEYLRSKTGKHFIDIKQDSFFQYSNLLYDSLKAKGRS